MPTAREYRRHANDCRLLARKLVSEQQRNQVLKMAEAWDGLAAELDSPVDGQEKLDRADCSFPNPQLGFANFPG